MKVFLSWSGERSKAMAQALKEWLPLCIQSLEPWMSAADIDKGARWFEQIEAALASADGQGIFCVTPENLSSPWLNFEAGFVASKGGKARVCALLVGLDAVDVKPPISLFQLTTSTRDDLLQLVKSLNQQCSKPLGERVLDRAFEMNWPELEKAIQAVISMKGAPAAHGRSVSDTLAELVGITRRLEQSVAEQSSQIRRLRYGGTSRSGPSQSTQAAWLLGLNRADPASMAKLQALMTDSHLSDEGRARAAQRLMELVIGMKAAERRDGPEVPQSGDDNSQASDASG